MIGPELTDLRRITFEQAAVYAEMVRWFFGRFGRDPDGDEIDKIVAIARLVTAPPSSTRLQ